MTDPSEVGLKLGERHCCVKLPGAQRRITTEVIV